MHRGARLACAHAASLDQAGGAVGNCQGPQCGREAAQSGTEDRIVSEHSVYRVDKADPHGFCHEVPPRTASVVAELWYNWGEQILMAERAKRNALAAPMAIYEIRLGSWRRVPEEGDRPLSYRELAPRLAEYVQRLGFTHVEFLPVMEHPFYGSWGYEITGFFVPTSRYGTPQRSTKATVTQRVLPGSTATAPRAVW
jgi:pullulanase/glycogen debranching enzyme